jgi:ferrous-iron efflux pump FieF
MSEKTNKHERLIKFASSASLVTALSLLVLKLFAYMSSGSLSILASTLDSLLDLLASFINFIAIRYALKPADKEHPFGHGKAEALAALAQGGFILSSALYLIFQAVMQLVDPEPLSSIATSMYIMVISVVMTSGLLMLQRYVVAKTGSLAIKADSAHYLSDLLANGLVIVALILVSYGLLWVDPIIAIAVGFFILYSALQIAYEAIQLLLDRELDDQTQEKIRTIVLTDKAVHAIHELKTRQSGLTQFIQLHIEMDGKMTLREAHDIADRVHKKLLEAFPQAEVIIHQDPYNDAEGDLPRITEDQI